MTKDTYTNDNGDISYTTSSHTKALIFYWYLAVYYWITEYMEKRGEITMDVVGVIAGTLTILLLILKWVGLLSISYAVVASPTMVGILILVLIGWNL